jgi:hypothetical protein
MSFEGTKYHIYKIQPSKIENKRNSKIPVTTIQPLPAKLANVSLQCPTSLHQKQNHTHG